LLNPDSNAFKFISQVPVDRLFLETDDSQLGIKEVYQQASVLLSISEDQLISTIFANYSKIFRV
jgi:TatD DNase family protein